MFYLLSEVETGRMCLSDLFDLPRHKDDPIHIEPLTGQAASQNLFMRNLRDREPCQISAVQQELQYHVMLRKALHNLILKMQRWILNENHFNFFL